MSLKYTLLLIEDDHNLGFVIKDNLIQKGYNVTLCANGKEAITVFDKNHFHLCLVDVMLPYIDGFSVARHIRKHDHEIPIIFITAKSATEDKLEGFKTGADDYILKPFSLEELIYRIEVFIKRRKTYEPKTTQDTLCIGNYSFDIPKQKLLIDGIERILTQREAAVLHLLCTHKGDILKREYILKQVWGDDDYFMGRSLDVFISKLRKYLKDDPRIEILNHHGIGFELRVNS